MDKVDWQPPQFEMPEVDESSKVYKARELLTAGVVQTQGGNSGEETLQILQVQDQLAVKILKKEV